MPAAEALARFTADLNALAAPGARLGLAVSGGPDSLALLLLAAAARPGLVRAATVDHALRAGSRAEAEAVAALCKWLDVPHDILTIDWPTPPASALQERTRTARYAALGHWALAHRLGTVATGHHADDQAETMMMRLVRGAGVRGLAGMRPVAAMPGVANMSLIRPLLGWRRAELADVVAEAGITSADDPSNHDERHERVRVRGLLAGAPWLDPAALARSARHLAAADEAIDYAVDREWSAIRVESGTWHYSPDGLPSELRRRITARIIAALASEGDGTILRGRELDHLLGELEVGRSVTLRGVAASGGSEWRFTRATPRR